METTRGEDLSSSDEEKEVVKTFSTDPAASIEDIFRCPICLGRVRNAQMCPSCSKMCCNSCIIRWLTEQRPQCPHCRATLHVSQLVHVRFVAEVSSELDKLKTSSLKASEEICHEHNAPLYYFCGTCSSSICSDCAMFDKKHQGHQFEHLRTVYMRHVELVKKEAQVVRKRLKELQSFMQALESNIESVSKSKDERSVELRSALDQMQARLDAQLKVKLLTLLAHKNTMEEEINVLSSMLNDVTKQLANSPKGKFIEKSNNLVKVLKELSNKPPAKFIGKLPVSPDFESEIVPPYASGLFKIKNYSKIRHDDVIYSDSLHTNGLTWRLKVYPNGNGVARGSYLSVFLEMVKGVVETAKYEYRVEMVNHKNPRQCVVREFASDFEEGECWGYNRFFQIENLEKDGYLSEDDSITLRYYVRPPTYFQLARDQKRYIEQLEAQRSDAALRETQLKQQLETVTQTLTQYQKETFAKQRKLASSDPVVGHQSLVAARPSLSAAATSIPHLTEDASHHSFEIQPSTPPPSPVTGPFNINNILNNNNSNSNSNSNSKSNSNNSNSNSSNTSNSPGNVVNVITSPGPATRDILTTHSQELKRSNSSGVSVSSTVSSTSSTSTGSANSGGNNGLLRIVLPRETPDEESRVVQRLPVDHEEEEEEDEQEEGPHDSPSSLDDHSRKFLASSLEWWNDAVVDEPAMLPQQVPSLSLHQHRPLNRRQKISPSGPELAWEQLDLLEDRVIEADDQSNDTDHNNDDDDDDVDLDRINEDLEFQGSVGRSPSLLSEIHKHTRVRSQDINDSMTEDDNSNSNSTDNRNGRTRSNNITIGNTTNYRTASPVDYEANWRLVSQDDRDRDRDTDKNQHENEGMFPLEDTTSLDDDDNDHKENADSPASERQRASHSSSFLSSHSTTSPSTSPSHSLNDL